jgi:hypothetical protein
MKNNKVISKTTENKNPIDSFISQEKEYIKNN